MKSLEQTIQTESGNHKKLKNLVSVVAIATVALGSLKYISEIPNFKNKSKDYQIKQISQKVGTTPYNLSNPEDFISFQTKYNGQEYTFRLNGNGLSYSKLEIINNKTNELISSYEIEGQNAVGIIPLEENSLETKTDQLKGIYFQVLQKDPNDSFSNQFIKTIYFAKF